MGYNMAKLALAVEDERLKPPDRHILTLLALLCPYDGKTKKEQITCAPGNDKLAKVSGFTTKAIVDITARLEKWGHIQKLVKGGRETKKNNVWQVNLF